MLVCLLCLMMINCSKAQIASYSPSWGSNWSYSFTGLNPNKAYKLKVSGQYRPSFNNNAWERDAAWEFNTNGSSVTPYLLSQNANSTGSGNCDGRWTLNGVCQPYPTQSLYNTYFPPTYDFWIPLNSTTATVAFWAVNPSQSAGNSFKFDLYERICPIAGYNYGSDTIVVKGTPASYTLDAGAGYVTYAWSAGTANIFQSTTQTYNVNRQFGWYRSMVTDVFGCVGEKSHYVTMLKEKIFNHDTTICSAATITLHADTTGMISSYTPANITGYNGPFVNAAGNGNTYFYSTTTSSWTNANASVNANAVIMQNGGHLATINSLQENNYIRSIVPTSNTLNNSNDYIWFGLYQDTLSPLYAEESGGWTNVTGEPVNFTKWMKGEPNNQQGGPGAENYVQIWYDSTSWNDKYNAFNSPHVIEFEKRNFRCLWSTGDTTLTINVHPSVTTKYWFRVTDGAAVVSDTFTVTVTTPVNKSITVNGCNGKTVYNGNTYNSSTVLNQTIKNIQGCDSVYLTVNINVTPINPVTNSNNLTDCKNITYKGTTYTTSTVLRDTIKSYQGCDSIYNITNINVRKITPVNNNVTVAGCNTVTYKGNTYNNSTILRDTIFSYLGCDSIYNLTSINVNKITTSTINNNLSGCNSVVYKGNTYVNSITLIDTVKSFQGCDSIYNISNITVNKIVAITNTSNLSGCNSVVYKGNTYVNSITLRDTIKSYQGCDSVYNIANITVNKIVPVTNNTNLSGCNAVVYKGNTYNTSVVLRDTVKSFQGCDSIYNIANITVNKITTTTNSVNLTGCNSIVYKGITYTNSTTLRDTIKSYQGCDSVYNIAIINVNTITPVTNNIILNGCLSVTYKGTVYNFSAIVRDTVKSYQGCDSVYNVATITINKLSVIINSTTLIDCKDIIYNTITYTTSTVLGDTIKSYQGCDSIYNIVNIKVNKITPVSNTFVVTGCNAVTYKGNVYIASTVLRDTIKSYLGCDSIYNIATLNINKITTSTNNINLSGCNAVVYKGNTYVASTIIRDTIKSYQGCDSIYNIASITVNKIIAATSTINLSGCNAVIYKGNKYATSTMLRDTIKSYQGCDSIYDIANITVTKVVASTNITSLSGCNSVVYNGKTYTGFTILRDTVKSYQGCDSIYNITNIIVNVITPIIISNTVKGCGTVLYNGNPYSSSTTLSDTVNSYQGCDSIYHKVFIVVNPIPLVNVSLPAKVCIGNPLVATYTSSLNVLVSIVWNMGNNASVNDFGINYTYPTFGYYNVSMSATDTNGCVTNPFKTTVNVLPAPVIENVHDTTVFSGASFQFDYYSISILNNVVWQPATFLSSDTIIDPVCTPYATNKYTLNVTDNNGCIASKVISVKVINIPLIPNTFSPNGDGKHDKWEFGNITSDNITEVNVYDRNGHVIYANKKYDNSWDGKVGGQPIPMGTYYYIIKLNNIYSISGWVLIIR